MAVKAATATAVVGRAGMAEWGQDQAPAVMAVKAVTAGQVVRMDPPVARVVTVAGEETPRVLEAMGATAETLTEMAMEAAAEMVVMEALAAELTAETLAMEAMAVPQRARVTVVTVVVAVQEEAAPMPMGLTVATLAMAATLALLETVATEVMAVPAAMRRTGRAATAGTVATVATEAMVPILAPGVPVALRGKTRLLTTVPRVKME